MSQASLRTISTALAGRRAFLRAGALGGTGLAAAALFGCSSSQKTPDAAPPAAGAGSAAPKAINEELLSLNDPSRPFPYIVAEYPATPKMGGTFRMSTQYDIANFDPTSGTSNTNIAVTASVTEGLVGLKHGPFGHPVRADLIPRLAKTWETSPDGLTITFNLDDNIKFQNIAPINGRPMTSEDVKKVYERYKTVGVSQSSFANVEAINAPNPKTVQIKLKQPQPDFLTLLSTRILPIYALELVDTEDLKKGTKTIGTGAYQLKEARRGESITYVRNPEYRDKARAGYLDGAIWTIQPDPAARLAAFRVGQVDFADAPFRGLDESVAFKKSDPQYHMAGSPTLAGTVGIALNLKNPKYQDDRVRQAISLAFDRQSYIATLSQNMGVPHLPLQPWGYVFDTPPAADVVGPWMKLDIAESKKMLAAAGADKLTIDVVNYYLTEGAVGYFADNMNKSGIPMKIRTVDLVSFSAEWQTNKYADAAGGTTTGANLVADIFYKDMMKTNSPGNRWNLSDPQIDTWADQQSVELDPKKRKELLRKIWDQLNNKAYRPLTAPGVVGVGLPWPKYIRGWVPTGQVAGAIQASGDCGNYMYDMWFDK